MPEKAYIGAIVVDGNATTLINLNKQEGSTSNVAIYTWENRSGGNTYKYTYLELGDYKCWRTAEA